MSRINTVNVDPKGITAAGIEIDRGALIPLDRLVSGTVVADEGMVPFGQIFPYPELVTFMKWDAIVRAYSAVSGSKTYVLLEASPIGGSQMLLPLACIPLSSTQVELQQSAAAFSKELRERIMGGQISVIAGDLGWLIKS